MRQVYQQVLTHAQFLDPPPVCKGDADEEDHEDENNDAGGDKIESGSHISETEAGISLIGTYARRKRI